MLLQLKEETKAVHAAVEKVLITQLKNLNTVNEYAVLLSKLHGFFYPIENRVHELVNISISDLNTRKHCPNLESDLANLHFTPFSNNNLFADKINSFSYALGVLYVIEGSTLGGQIISKMLKVQVPTLQDNQLSYYNSYGNLTTEKWITFKEEMSQLESIINQSELFLGAHETFEALRLWLEK